MSYDPEQFGARCHECYLRDHRDGAPVGPEVNSDYVVVVTESPREKDVEVGRPLVDAAGMEFTQSLKSIGIPRNAVTMTTALACRPPENDLDKVLVRFSRNNKKRLAAGEDALPHPLDCCRPRLMHDIGQSKNLITLGKVAMQAVTGMTASITEVRGGPIEGRFDAIGNFITGGKEPLDVKVLPTLHPAFVLRARRWTRAFRSDLSRAFRWFQGNLGWKEPTITLNPTPDELEAFLSNTETPYIYDVETTFDDPLIAELKCVGIATENAAVVVHLLRQESLSRGIKECPYRSDDELRVRGILRDFFIDPLKLKVGHNAGAFDRAVIEQHFGVTPAPLMDTILLHRLVESELPHRLGYIGSVYTDVTAWKAAHTASEAQTDEELGTYCAIDCVVTARVLPKLAEATQLRGQAHLVEFDHKVQDICAGMHRVGMLVDRPLREEVAKDLKVRIAEHLQATREAAGNIDMNPNSVYQVRALLFDKWGLTPSDLTKLGDPSTSDDALRLLRTQNRDREDVVRFIDSLRKYRKASKEMGTYVARLVPYTTQLAGLRLEQPETDEGDDMEGAESERGLILADGRIHPNYLAHGTTSGRLSSSNPNAQNFPKHLRNLIFAQPGHVLVGADADQLELRIIASVAGITRYLEVLQNGADPHAETASMMFGKQFDQLEPKSDQWTKLRQIAKGIAYASFYGSGDETVHGLVTSAENKDGTLMYPDLTLAQVSTLRRRWLASIPQMQAWWDDCLETFQRQSFMIDPVMGRRRDFLDGEKFNEIINFGIQCVPGWTRVLTKEGYIPIDQLRGRDFVAWTGKRWATARVIYRGIKELYRVHTKRGQHFVCDDDHRGKFVGREGYEWRKFVDAAQGTRFAIDLAREHDFGQPMDELDAYVAGYWTGDGSSTPDGNHAHAISFVVAEGDGPRAGDEMEAKLTRWASDRGIEMRKNKQVGCFTLTFHKGATEWLLSIGADPAWKAHTKRIPESIWRADVDARKAFLRGLLDADGYATPDGGINLNLCQHQLLQDTMLLARTVGVEGAIFGPYASDRKGHYSFRLALNGSQSCTHLGWGPPRKLRTSTTGSSPRFECKRVLLQLLPTSDSERVIASRIKCSGTPSASPYILSRMGATDLYDHDGIVSVASRRINTPVFTLEVDDEDHQYVAEGVISKNSAGAHIIHLSTFDLMGDLPFEKWGYGTGLINQCHDALVYEVPCPHDQYEGKDAEFGWCPPKCRCEANKVARLIKESMNREIKGLDGVSFAAKPKIGRRWGEV